MISLSLDFKILIFRHIIFGHNIFSENMISNVDIKSLLGYRYEKGLGFKCRLYKCRLLEGSKQNYGCQCRPLQGKNVVGTSVGHYKGKNCCGRHY
jgi:hypothetical protein